MRIVDVSVGTPSWRAWRKGGLGGSDAPVLLGISRYRSARALLDEKRAAGPTPEPQDNLVLARGRALEPIARAAFEGRAGILAPPLCCEHEARGFLRASLDGYAADRDLPVEIKAPRRFEHREAIAGRVPRAHLAQCAHVLLVTGADRMCYVSYQPEGFAAAQALAAVTVRADATALAELLSVEEDFWEAVCTGRAPAAPRDVALGRLGCAALPL